MKFKVTPKDLLIFVIYCIILLYLCAILVLNLTSFLNEGIFYGLLPFEAFTPKYLPITIITFIAVLVVIFTSVSSYIFKKDKNSSGFGLNLKDKSSDGYSRWASDKDIKKQEDVIKVDPKADKLDAAGIPLINDGKKIWLDNSNYHNLVIGSTGSGKTQTIVKPLVNLLAKHDESMIITDPKGEIYKYSCDYLKKQGYKIVVLNFREPQKGNAWNPLTLPYQYYKDGNSDKAIELLNDVSLNILYDPNSKADPFWEKSAADYFSGLALGLFMDAKEKEINLNSINVMSNVGEERYATSNYIKEYFNMKGAQSTPYIFASNTFNAPSDTKGGILSTFRQKIRLFSTGELLSEMLSYSDFDMRELGNGKTAVFMIIHDEKKTYHSLMTIFIKQCYETLIDVAQENGGKLPYRTNFILDEFANMPPLKDVDAMISAARSRDIRFTFIIQNFAQLNDVYGPEVAEIIKGNCGNIIYLISTEMKALEEISKMCGEVKADEKDKNATRPLVSITDLQKMKLFQAIIKRLRTDPFKTSLTPDFKMDWGIERKEEPYPNREKKPVEIFDLKKFVTTEKNKKMEKMGGGMGFNPGMNPFNQNSIGASPFGPSPMNIPSFNPNSNQNPHPHPNSMNTMDIDEMLKDLDEKFKELDKLEEENKEEEKELDNDIVLPGMKKPKQTEKFINKTKEEPIEKPIAEPIEKPIAKQKEVDIVNEKETNNDNQDIEVLDEEPPKINVDKDSVIVNENVITDDEFFDDFFGDE